MKERAGIYIAAIARSGSTAISNMLTLPPMQQILVEPSAYAFGMNKFNLLEDSKARDRYLDTCNSMLGFQLSKPEKWGVKEVHPACHFGAIELLEPKIVLLLVRDIRAVFLSLLEKHRIQNAENIFSKAWTIDYCEKASTALSNFRRSEVGRDAITLRYEDFLATNNSHFDLGAKLGWSASGDPFRGFAEYDRLYEIERNANKKRSPFLAACSRGFSIETDEEAEILGLSCAEYQRMFGYAS